MSGKTSVWLPLPLRFVLYGGTDRHGALFAALGRVDSRCPGVLSGRELRLTLGDYSCYTASPDGIAVGRLWLEWS